MITGRFGFLELPRSAPISVIRVLFPCAALRDRCLLGFRAAAIMSRRLTEDGWASSERGDVPGSCGVAGAHGRRDHRPGPLRQSAPGPSTCERVEYARW